MYREYFGLVREPFNIAPDPSFLYLSPSHREALAQLIYGINARKGFIVLTGEVGTGKTTLIRTLLDQLDDKTHTAFIFNTVVGPRDLLRYLCEDFRLIELGSNHAEIHDYLTLLHRFLLEAYRRGDGVVVIIDEAQNLSGDVLETVRLLSNFETSTDKLLQILMVGQPELGLRLNSLELRQLKQRVTLRYHLKPLTLLECRAYIDWRMQVAGGTPAVFSQKAMEVIFHYSKGIPRVINVLCDNGMLTAYGLGKQAVDAAMIEEIAGDLNLIPGPEPSPSYRKPPSAHIGRRGTASSWKKGTGGRWKSWLMALFFLSLVAGGLAYVWVRFPDFHAVYMDLINEIVEEFKQTLGRLRWVEFLKP